MFEKRFEKEIESSLENEFGKVEFSEVRKKKKSWTTRADFSEVQRIFNESQGIGVSVDINKVEETARKRLRFQNGGQDSFQDSFQDLELSQDPYSETNIQHFRNKSLTENLFELNWRSFDPNVIIDFMIASAEIISGIEFFDYQKVFLRRIFRSVILREGATIVGVWARQSGKTQTTSVAIITLCILMPKLGQLFEELKDFRRGFYAGIFAPTEKQAKISYQKIKSISRSERCKNFLADPAIQVGLIGEGVKFTNGSLVFYGSAKMSSNIEGDTGHLIYLDETQDIKEDVFYYKINPMRAFTNATLVSTGVPSDNYFFKNLYNESKVNSAFLPQERKLLFEFNYNIVSKYNKFYDIFVKNEMKKRGDNSTYFRRNFLLDWSLFENTNNNFNVDIFIKNCCKDYLGYNDYSGGPVVGGLDIAYVGTSVFTIGEVVITERNNGDFLYKEMILKILNVYYFTNYQTIKLQDEVAEIIRKFDNRFLFTFDATGGGQFFVDTFKKTFSDLSGCVKSFSANKKSKSYLTNAFIELVNGRKIYYPSSEDARREEKWKNFMKQLSHTELVEFSDGVYFNSFNKTLFPDDFIDSFLLCVNSFLEYERYSGISYTGAENIRLKPNPLYQKNKSKFQYRFPMVELPQPNEPFSSQIKPTRITKRLIFNDEFVK